MENLEKIAQELEQATKQQTITLSDLKTLIENRKIAALKHLFPDEQAQNIDKIFYYFDKKGRKQVTSQKIVFNDFEYVAVQSEKYSQRSGKYYHAVWVLGVENGKPWIHRLEWSSVFEDENYKWTAESIRARMGFSSATTEPYSFELNKTVRIQGDLTLTKISTIENLLGLRVMNAKYEAEKAVKQKFASIVEAKVKAEIAKDVADADQFIATKNWNALKIIRQKYNIHGKREETSQKISSEYYAKVAWNGHPNTPAELLIYNKLYAQSNTAAQVTSASAEAEAYTRAQPEPEGKQVCFRMGNHVITVEKAFLNEKELIRGGVIPEITVYQPTSFVAIHDEHGTTIVNLSRGVYRASFLTRHITDQNHHVRGGEN